VPVAVVEKAPTSRVRAVRPRLPKAVEPVVVDAPVALVAAPVVASMAPPPADVPAPLAAAPSPPRPAAAAPLQPAPPRPKPKAAARADAADDDAPKRAAATQRRTYVGADAIVGLRDLAPKDHPTFSDLKGDPEWELALKARAGDKRAMSTLLVAHDGFIVNTAKRFFPMAEDPEGAAQVARMGFMRAIKTWEREEGALSTYAFGWIRQAVTRYMGDCEGDIRVPIHAGAATRKAIRLGATTAEEAVKLTGLSAAGVAWDLRYRARRLNALMNDDADADSLIDVCHGDMPTPEEVSTTLDRRAFSAAMIERAMVTLTPRQQEVIRRRLLCNDGEALTLDEMGQEFGVTREAIRLTEVRALDKLRKRLSLLIRSDERDSLWTDP
jgi:RNA polymerase sigma factor (sigma-70 family)